MPEQHDDDTDFSRRTFMKASGAVAGAGLLGASAASSAAAETDVPLEFSNPRVLRASHAWDRGYRGRPDRSVGLTDSGTDSRHPDLGPWNGITVTSEDDFELWRFDADGVPETEELDTETVSGLSLPEGLETQELDVPEGTGRISYTLEYDVDEALLSATLLEIETDDDGEEVSETEVAAAVEQGHTATYDFVDETKEYVLEVGDLDAQSTYEIEVEYLAYTDNAPERNPVDTDDLREEIENLEEPQLVGWHNDSFRYGSYRAPRDENSHGTHVAGIMTATGQGSTIDSSATTVEQVNTVLIPGDTLSYEVTAEADTGVFASAYGEGIELAIEGPDGRELATSGATQGAPEIAFRNNTTETTTVHDSGTATYTVYVRGIEGEALPAQVESVAAGAFKHHSETAGDVDEDETTMHAGTAPGFSLVSVTDLGVGTSFVASDAENFAKAFNLRAVNMSWGYVGGAPLGAFGGALDTTPGDIRALAEAGILSVAAAGNDASPASGNGAPAVANEAVSTVATGPLDGIAAYSSGGLGGIDDESFEPYTKPDVAAIGGALTDLDMASMPGDDFDNDDPYTDGDNHGTERTYAGKGGTSMAAPSACGIAGLIMQAMEEADNPSGIDLPEPTELAEMDGDDARAWVLKAKQALLATSSPTAFNAAPYHGAKAPTYTPGERDPYEGWGRVNAGAAVDAVSRNLLADDELDDLQSVGLDIPRDEQAVAGFINVDGGEEVEITVDFSHYGGANSGMTKGDPHLDVFVYDALNPEGADGDGPATGDPNIVESDQGIGGDASVAFETDDGGVFYVVVKLVSVPGVVNGFDVQALFDLDIDAEVRDDDEDEEDEDEDEDEDDDDEEEALVQDGERDTDSSVYQGGQTARNELAVSTSEDVILRDRVPAGFDVEEDLADVEATTPALDGTFVYFGLDGDDEFDVRHFSKAPEDIDQSGDYEFGPLAVTTDVDDDGTLTDRDWEDIEDTDATAVVVATGVPEDI